MIPVLLDDAQKAIKNAASSAASCLVLGFLPFGLCFAGRGSPARSQQVRLGDVAKIKVKAEAIGKQPVHVGSIIAWLREGVKR
jgi:hypothetical protein